jgi:hypothetical protein
LIGYAAEENAGHHLGHGITFVNVTGPTKAIKLAWMHEALHGIGTHHAPALFPGPFENDERGYRFAPQDVNVADSSFLGDIGSSSQLSKYYVGVSPWTRLNLGWPTVPPVRLGRATTLRQDIERSAPKTNQLTAPAAPKASIPSPAASAPGTPGTAKKLLGFVFLLLSVGHWNGALTLQNPLDASYHHSFTLSAA